jgi:hypothetical protein
MQDFIGNITEFFSGKSNAPANPDVKHNIYLLNETKAKIETGVFTRFFKKPIILAGEISAYISTVVLALLGIFVWSKINTLLDVLLTAVEMHNFFGEAKWDSTLISVIDLLLFIVCAMPAFICFLLGRFLSKSRKRIKTFVQVENMIDRVIYNLQEK